MITNAPVSFAIMVIIVSAATFGLLKWHFNDTITIQNATIESLRERVDKLSFEKDTEIALSPPSAASSRSDFQGTKP